MLNINVLFFAHSFEHYPSQWLFLIVEVSSENGCKFIKDLTTDDLKG